MLWNDWAELCLVNLDGSTNKQNSLFHYTTTNTQKNIFVYANRKVETCLFVSFISFYLKAFLLQVWKVASMLPLSWDQSARQSAWALKSNLLHVWQKEMRKIQLESCVFDSESWARKYVCFLTRTFLVLEFLYFPNFYVFRISIFSNFYPDNSNIV